MSSRDCLKSTGRFFTRERLEQYVVSSWVQTSMTSTEIAKRAGASSSVVNCILKEKKADIDMMLAVYPEVEAMLLAISCQPHYRVPKEAIVEDAARELLSKVPPNMREVDSLVESTYALLNIAYVESGYEEVMS